MQDPSIQAWADAANKPPLLSEAEIIHQSQIVQRWRNDEVSSKVGNRALNRLVDGNLRLVVLTWSREFRYLPHTDSRVPDLLQEGALGLRESALKFDPSRGYKFSTYAMGWIRRYMLNAFKFESRPIYLPSDVYQTGNKAKKFIERYALEHGKQPTMDEVAKQCKKKPYQIEFILQKMSDTQLIALDMNHDENKKSDATGETLIDVIASRPGYDYQQDKENDCLYATLVGLMNGAGLTEDERLVVHERYLFGSGGKPGRTLKDIKNDFGPKSQYTTATSALKAAIRKMKCFAIQAA